MTSKKDLDNAINYLKENHLLEEVRHSEETYDIPTYEDDLDDYYFYQERNKNMMEDVDAIDVDVITIGEMIEGAMDNMSDEQLDDEIRFFKGVGRHLKVKNYDDVIVTIDDGEYDPSWILQDGEKVKVGGRVVEYYPSANLLLERNPQSGNNFYYFPTQEDAGKYVALANKFLNEDELSKDVFAYDEGYGRAIEEKLGSYNDDGEFIEESNLYESLEDALNKLDKVTGNRYNLLNRYFEQDLNEDRKSHIVDLLKEDKSAELIHKYLKEDNRDEMSPYDFVRQSVENGVSSGEISFEDDYQKNKILAYLNKSGIKYDSMWDSKRGEYTISWYVGDSNKKQIELKKDMARRALDYLRFAVDALEEYLDDDRYFAKEYGSLIVSNLEDALGNCKDIFEEE